MSDAPSMPTTAPSVTFWGAAQSVSGSMHVLETAAGLVLLDCGLVQGRRGEADRRNSSFPFHPKKIAAVIISHAHIDHCGNLPTLVRQGFRGPIYATPLTMELAAVMLADSAKIQEEESAYSNIRRRYAEPTIEPLYATSDAARTTGLFRPVPFGVPYEVLPGVMLTYSDAGHLPGSAVTHVKLESDGLEYSITYTGDLGRFALDVLPPPAPLPAAGIVLSECTYGARRHPSVSETLDKLAAALNTTADRNGKVIVPAFGLGRTQLVVHFLCSLMTSGRATKMPIFVDSPLAANIADVFRRHPDAFRFDMANEIGVVHYVASFEESMKLLDRPGPCVIVASGGMCEGGRIQQHLSRTVDDPSTTIVLVSYQAQRTIGRQILDRPAHVHFLGKDWPMWADVLHLEGFSGHADRDDLLKHLMPLVDRNPTMCLVHGELMAANSFRADLQAAGFRDVRIPAAGDRIELQPD